MTIKKEITTKSISAKIDGIIPNTWVGKLFFILIPPIACFLANAFLGMEIPFVIALLSPFILIGAMGAIITLACLVVSCLMALLIGLLFTIYITFKIFFLINE